MSPQIPLVSSKKALAALRRLGFEEARREGSYVTLIRERAGGGKDVTVIVDAKGEIPRGTLKSTLELGRVTIDEFTSALR